MYPGPLRETDETMPNSYRSNLVRAATFAFAALTLLRLSESTSLGEALPRFTFGTLQLRTDAPTLAPESLVVLPVASASPAAAIPSRPLDRRQDPLARLPFGDEIRKAALREGLDPLLLAAVVEVESNFSADAVSPKGAMGLMQLMPLHFEEGAEPLDPIANLALGARYLRQLTREYDSLALALAAYQAGPGAVERAGGRPPYRSTMAYVRRVLDVYDRLRSAQRGEGPIS